VEDPVEIQPPGGDSLLVVLRVCKSRQQIPSTFLGDLLLDPSHGSAIKGVVSGRVQDRIRDLVYYNYQSNSRRQLLNRLVYGSAEFNRSPFTHPPVESATQGPSGKPQICFFCLKKPEKPE